MPAFLLTYFGGSLGTMASYLSSGLLLLFFIFSKPSQKLAIPFLLCAILYFTISGLNYHDDELFFLKEFLRVVILILGINQVMYKTDYKDIFVMMVLCGLSIIVNGLVFPEANVLYGLIRGRFSGFLLNPNAAGIACLLGMALSYSIKNMAFRLSGQLILTFAGILTLSRTFILVWTIIVLVAVIRDKKNLLVPFIGICALIILTTFTDKKIFAADRFEALTSFFLEGEVKTKVVGYDTRDQTWALYYDLVFEKPLIGNGFRAFQLKTNNLPGVHNSYLMIIGESGIIPFLFFVGIYIYLLGNCLVYYQKDPVLLYVLIVVMLSIAVTHTYYFVFINLALSIFVFVKLRDLRKKEIHPESQDTFLTN